MSGFSNMTVIAPPHDSVLNTDVFPQTRAAKPAPLLSQMAVVLVGGQWKQLFLYLTVHCLVSLLKLLVGRRPKTFISLRTNFRMLIKTVNTMKFFKISESVTKITIL